MPDPLLTTRHRRGARPAWGVPTGASFKFWEAQAFRARKDSREDTRHLMRYAMAGGDRRAAMYTGAPVVIDKDVRSNQSVFNSFTGTLRTDYARELESKGLVPAVVRTASTTHLGIGYERAEAEEETLPTYRQQQGRAFGVLMGPAAVTEAMEEQMALARQADREAAYCSGGCDSCGGGGGTSAQGEQPHNYAFSVPTGFRNAERRAMQPEMSESEKELERLRDAAESAEVRRSM